MNKPTYSKSELRTMFNTLNNLLPDIHTLVEKLLEMNIEAFGVDVELDNVITNRLNEVDIEGLQELDEELPDLLDSFQELAYIIRSAKNLGDSE